MEIHFSCPACQQSLTMDAAHAGSQVSCPACGQAFIVAGAPKVLPVVQASAPHPPAPQPPSSPPRPQRPPAPQAPRPPSPPQRPGAAHPGTRPGGAYRPPAVVKDDGETKAKVFLAFIFLGGIALIGGLVYAGVRITHRVQDEPIIPKEIVELEKRNAAEARARLKKEEDAEKALADQKRVQLRNFLSLNVCEGRDDVADELIKELEAAEAELSKEADAGRMPDDPMEFLQRHLVTQITQNRTLRQWFGSHSQRAFLGSIFGAPQAPQAPGGPIQGKVPDFLARGNYGSLGTGFYISASGLLLTNHHVVGEHTEADVRFPDGQIHKARVLQSDAKLDLALLKTDSSPGTWLDVASKDASMGSSVFTIGFPRPTVQGVSPKFTDGKVSSLSGVRDDPTRYQISVPVQPGNSGGPLVSLQTGGVIGVVSSRLNGSTDSSLQPENVNYAIKSSVVQGFLSTASQWKERDGDRPAESDPNVVIDRVKAATVLILVER